MNDRMSAIDPYAVDDRTSEINLTPLLDVVFILLIFFLVVSAFVDLEGIPVMLPGAAEPAPEVEAISVTVAGDGVFVVSGRILSRGSLFPYIAALRSRNPDATFGLLVAAGASVQDTVAAADAGRRAGFEVIPLTTIDRVPAGTGGE